MITEQDIIFDNIYEEVSKKLDWVLDEVIEEIEKREPELYPPFKGVIKS